MKCHKCGTIIRDNVKYCPECGTPIVFERKTIQLICKSCGGRMDLEEDRPVLFCPFCGSKELIEETEAVSIQRIKSKTYKEVELARINSEVEKTKLAEERSKRLENSLKLERFKVGLFSKYLVLIMAVCIIAAIIAFSNRQYFAGLIAVMQALLIITSWMMGMQMIKEKIPNLHTLLAIIAVLLTIFYVKSFVYTEQKDNNTAKVEQTVDPNAGVDKYSIKNYVGKNVAAIGNKGTYYHTDSYGDARIRLIFLCKDGTYIDINNKEQLKQYVVVGQSIPEGEEISVVHEIADNGQPSILLAYQSYEEIILQVEQIEDRHNDIISFTPIKPTSDINTYYIRDYIGRNAASFGDISEGGRVDRYGDARVKFIYTSDDGRYIDPGDLSLLREYIIVGQDISPNTELKLEYDNYKDGSTTFRILRNQSFDEINLNVRRLSDQVIDTMPELSPLSISIAEVSEEMKLTYRVMFNGKIEITGVSNDGNYVYIPSEIEGKEVVKIGKGAFEDCKRLRLVTIMADIEEIADYAFKGCTVLTSISIPAETKDIGKHAFEDCTYLEYAHLWGDPNIGDYAFRNCANLSSLSYSNKSGRIGKHAYENCVGMTSVFLWDVDTIDDYAFSGCTGITYVSIPGEAKRIGKHAFDGCINLSEVNHYGNTTIIDETAFSNCPKLNS